MKKKKIIIITGIIALLFIGAFTIKSFSKRGNGGKFEFEEIKRGNLEDIVSCTGTLSAVSTVNVGSQVSGIVDKMFVDYNDNVKKGQLLAVLDKTLFITSVKDAEAGILRARAQYEQAQAELKRNQPLFEKGHLSEAEFLVTKTNADTTTAALRSAESTLKRAQTQLAYTEIRSPIDGTIIERAVDAGQTIAASFQAPKLFIIAEDLTKMQIDTDVDESDIGQIKEGQSVRFTVQAYMDETFTGKVRQIRLSPTTIQNVVNYIVVVDAANDKKLLLPGMTATVDFMVQERKDVLLVPNNALSFTPPQEMLQKIQAQMAARRQNNGKGENNGAASGGMGRTHEGFRGGNPGITPPGNGMTASGGMMPGNGMMMGGKLPEHMGRVFYLDDKGMPAMAFLEKGVTDGKMTEIKHSKHLTEGMKVIIAYLSGNTTKKNNNPPMMFPMGGRH
ncbi:MAG TPA: efflux RND transporter periplasmic adaptor subunit [Candidatus Deferrimicrobium sp.]|nr:efflux RND transporter periplasmic adaptor subunit [Candidatus Deferrimicrobium sp.]